MQIFVDRCKERLSSLDIVEALTRMEDRPWGAWRRGQPLNQNSVSKILQPHGIVPKKYRVGDSTFRGYELGPIAEAYRRYGRPVIEELDLKPSGRSGTLELSRNSNGLGLNESGTIREMFHLSVPQPTDK
jgi:hypothetical protein